MSNPERPIGWRKRIGLLSPSVIETAAYDFYRLAPDGVTMCAISSNIEHWSTDNFKQHVLDPLLSMSRYLSSRAVDFIIHTGMPVVTTRGKGFDEEVVNQIEQATGVPATTSIRSAIRALAHLDVRNVALVTPYPQELHRSAVKFIADSGFKVAADHTEDVVFKHLHDVTPAHIASVAKRVLASAPAADGVYIPCNQWAAADAAPLIEKEVGVPVVTGAHADYWAAFQALHITDRIDNHGRLMASLSAPERQAVSAH